MMLYFIPVGGFANRIRAIDSAVNMSNNQKNKLRVLWIKDSGLNCDFKSIFKPVSFIIDCNCRFINSFFYLRRRFASVRLILRLFEKTRLIKVFMEDEYEALSVLAKKKSSGFCFILIRSYSSFYPTLKFQKDLFQLRPDIDELVKKETEVFNKNTMGVHIRRTDNLNSIRMSPLEIFEEQMSKEMDSLPETTFYLISDDQIIKDYFATSPKWKRKVILTTGRLDRNSKEGIVQAAVELFALSRTKKILGSYWSSYSEIAALFGNIELKVVKKTFSANCNI